MKILISLAALTLALTACSAGQAHTATRSSSPAPAQTAAVPQQAPSPDSGAPAAAAGSTVPGTAAGTCSFSRAGSGPGSTRIVSAAASDDSFTLTFDGGVPTFEAAPQVNSRFVLSPIGQTITLPGTAGVFIKFTNLTMGAYGNLPQSFSTGGPLMLQIRKLEDFEGTVSFGVGLNAAGCASADVSGSTVTFHFLETGKG